MSADVTVDRVPATSIAERKHAVRLMALWPFLVAVGILAIVALISDASLTPDQRIEVFQQSGFYP